MSSLQEIIAAKKAEAAAKNLGLPPARPALLVIDDKSQEISSVARDEIDKKAGDVGAAEKTIEAPVKKEEAAIVAPKALTFAEKMALKRKEVAQATIAIAPAVTVVPSQEDASNPKEQVELNMVHVQLVEPTKETAAPTHASIDIGIPVVRQIPDGAALRTGMTNASLDANPMPAPDKISPENSVDPQIVQAYADIRERIDRLNELADMNLENAMKELKKALMANPAAVSLMEDSDIGQLVIALRKITGEAIAEAAKDNKPGRKPKNKQIDLTDPAVVAAVIDEL
jgi:hypothetical protein